LDQSVVSAEKAAKAMMMMMIQYHDHKWQELTMDHLQVRP